MKILSSVIFFTLLTLSKISYCQKIKGDSLESNTFFNYNFDASTSKSNALRSKYEENFKNPPKKINGKFKKSGFFIYLDTTHITKNKDGLLCHQLFLVNNSDSILSFSKLYIEPEILDNKGKWKTKNNYLDFDNPYTGSMCGTDYYKVYLSSNEYWSFNVPILKGSYKTKLRYRFMHDKSYIDFMTSEIDVYVNLDTISAKTTFIPYSYIESRSSSQRSIISLDQMNVLYDGLYNPITVEITDSRPSNIFLSLSCGRAIKDSTRPNSYFVSFDSAYSGERELSITVFSRTINDSNEYKGKHLYRIRKIPKPTPMLGSISKNGVVSKGVLKSASFVFALLENFPFQGVKYTVTNFTIEWKQSNGKTISLEGEGNKISPNIRRIFQFSEPGDQFTVKDVKAIGPNGLESITEVLTVTVK